MMRIEKILRNTIEAVSEKVDWHRRGVQSILCIWCYAEIDSP